MTEIEIGRAKRGRQAYAFDDIAIVPSRRTRDPEEVSVAWQIDAYRFELPILAAPMDSVMSPATAIAIGKAGGLGVLNLEGLWTRYEDPTSLLEEITSLETQQATHRLQEIYAAPIKPELISQRVQEIRDSGVTVAGALSPQRTKQFAKHVVDAGVDLFVIRGTTVSAEHVSGQAEPLGDQLRLDRLGVDLLHPPGRVRAAQAGDLREQRLGVLVAGPQALEVQHPQPAGLAQRDGGRRRHHRVHRRGQHGQLEAVGVDLPGDADLLGVARAARRHDRDVVEGVGPAGALGAADLDLLHEG